MYYFFAQLSRTKSLTIGTHLLCTQMSHICPTRSWKAKFNILPWCLLSSNHVIGSLEISNSSCLRRWCQRSKSSGFFLQTLLLSGKLKVAHAIYQSTERGFSSSADRAKLSLTGRRQERRRRDDHNFAQALSKLQWWIQQPGLSNSRHPWSNFSFEKSRLRPGDEPGLRRWREPVKSSPDGIQII